jgi:regulatory protein YycI of two-component signal transduction system YycFG
MKDYDKIERRFSVADELERTVDQSLKQAKRLRQSILKKAFEGKLVTQDRGDESLEDSENLPDPDILARDIAENLESALEQFSSIYEDLEKS